jgi:Protein of unknown function (DUF3152)
VGRHSRRGLAARGDAEDTAVRRDQPRAAGKPGAGGTTDRSGAPDGAGTGAARGGQQGPAPQDRQPGPVAGPVTGAGPIRPVGRRRPRTLDATPARGVPLLPDETPARGVPRTPDGAPRTRGGHPEQREPGGGWGRFGGAAGAEGPGGPSIPHQRHAPPAGPGAGTASRSGPGTAPGDRPHPGTGPRQEYLDAFDPGDGEDGNGDAPGRPRSPRPSRTPKSPNPPRNGRTPEIRATATSRTDPYAAVTDWPPEPGFGVPGDPPDGEDTAPTGEPAPGKGAKGRAFTGIAAAAVTTVLAIVVAGQVTDGRDETGAQAQSATDQARDTHDAAGAAAPEFPSAPSVAPLTYRQKMDTKYALLADFKGSGTFDAVPGVDRAPGKGRKYTYRVDVEQGLGLDGALFAEAVQKTLNDNRSWSHNGARTFERIHTGRPDFVITLASPGTTAVWCAKSGLDTTEDNVSCDSAATERVMINAYRWAQGSKTFGDEIHAYRQMLINHEVGHRLGYHHVTCETSGELAPVMQQQTKFLDHDGIHCLPNSWPYPAKS